MPRLRVIADAAAVRIAAVLAVCLSVFARADTVFWRRRAVSLHVYYSTSVAFTRRGNKRARGTRDVTRGHDKSAQKFLYNRINNNNHRGAGIYKLGYVARGCKTSGQVRLRRCWPCAPVRPCAPHSPSITTAFPSAALLQPAPAPPRLVDEPNP